MHTAAKQAYQHGMGDADDKLLAAGMCKSPEAI